MLEVPQALLDDRRAKGLEPFANRDGRMEPVEPVHIQALDIRAETVEGTLRLTWDGGSATV